jgi:endoglucanase
MVIPMKGPGRSASVAGGVAAAAGLIWFLVIDRATDPAPTAAPTIKVVGNQIVTTSAGRLGVQQVASGQAITLRGVNLSGAEYSCDTGSIWDSPPGDLTTIGHIRDDWAANTVRVPLNEGYWLGLGGRASCRGSKYRAAISAFVERATGNGLIAEVDLHFGIGARTDDYPIFDAAHAEGFWTSVATTFKNDHAVIFNLINEPHGITWVCLMQGTGCPAGETGVKPVLNAVRGTGATNPVIIAGLDWSDDLSQWMKSLPVDPLETTDPGLGSQLIAGFHPYFGLGNRCETEPPTCWDDEIAPIQTAGYTGTDGRMRTYPVIADEFGDVGSGCSGRKIATFMDWADAQTPPIGYWAWTFTDVACSDPGLITDAAGTPSRRYGATFKAHLIEVQGWATSSG